MQSNRRPDELTEAQLAPQSHHEGQFHPIRSRAAWRRWPWTRHDTIDEFDHECHHIDPEDQKLHETEVFTFKGQKERYNESKHLPLNHIRLFQKKNTEEEKLQFFKSLLREDAIEFWQTILVTPDTTLREVIQMFRKENAPNDFKEVSRYRWNQSDYQPQHESFWYFLIHLKKTTKQASDSKANQSVKELVFGKLPVAFQNDLSVAGNQGATVHENRVFIPRRF